MANINIPPPEQVGAFFAPQYYGLLCNQPNLMHYFYSEHSTMILVINHNSTTIASETEKIHTLLMSLNFDMIEIKSINSRECWGGGVLLVVSGFVQIKNVTHCCCFVHTMCLAPKAHDGYFIMNDILHIIDNQIQVILSNPVTKLSSEQIDPRFHSEHPPPKSDNGDLDAEVVKKIDDLMSLIVNEFEFPKLQRQPQRQRRGGRPPRNDIQIQQPVVISETPTPVETASSSNSSSVANIDTIHENIDALQIEESVVVQEEVEPSQISNTSILVPLPPSTSTSRGRGRGINERGSSSGSNKGKEKVED